MSTDDGGQDAAVPDVPYDPALSTRAFMDWRDVGRKPGGTGKRGVWAFLRDNLVGRPPGNAARSGRPVSDPDETHSP